MNNKDAILLASGPTLVCFEYDGKLFNGKRIGTHLCSKYAFPEVRPGTEPSKGTQISVSAYIPVDPGLPYESLRRSMFIPVEIFICYQEGLGFVEISTNNERHARNPIFYSLVEGLADSSHEPVYSCKIEERAKMINHVRKSLTR